MKTRVQVIASLFIAAQALGQETIRITFDGPPIQAPGTAYVAMKYYESGMLFTELKGSRGFTRTGAATSGFPDDGTAFVQAAPSGMQFRFTNGMAFDLIAVDLAEYSTVFQTPTTIPFVGYHRDGTTVATNFTTDGIIDGPGPLADFQTFYFGAEFTSLDHVKIPATGWSLDNLVVHTVQPSHTPPDPVRFGAVTNFPAGGQRSPAQTMVAGDFNGDGITDLAVLGSEGINVLLGAGNGAFGAPIATSFSSGPGVMAAADINADGNLDLVVAEGNLVHILLGDASGAFPLSSTLTNFAGGPVAVAVADFNADGRVDLAIANYFGIRFALGEGDGSFGSPLTYPLVNRPTDMRAADINGDGTLDLAVSLLTSDSANPTNSNSFCVLTNNGKGGFGPPQYYPASARDDHYSLELADFLGDGKSHIAVLNYYSNSITLWANQGGLLVQTNEYRLASFTTNVSNLTNLVAGDFNGDGRTDLLIGSGAPPGPGGSQSSTTKFWVLLGAGGMTFTSGGEVTVKTNTAHPRPIVVADYNGDGKPDVAFINGLSAGVLLNESLPVLAIARLGSYNDISWSTILGSGFTLEYATNISPPGAWQSFPSSPTSIGSWTRIVDWANGEAKFYRLRK